MKRVKAKKKPKAKKAKSRAKATKQPVRKKSNRMRTASDGGASGPPD